MTASWRKLIRDLSQEGTRTVLVVFAVAVGIAGFLAVLSTYAILTRELNRGYLQTDPASATLRMDPIDDAMMAAVAADPEIGAVDARRIVLGRIKTGPADWHNLKLFVLKDFAGIRIGKLQPKRGAWPPSAGDILIERDAFSVAPLHIGDVVTVKTPGGSESTLRVSGSILDVGQAQARMENVVYGYITEDTLPRLGQAAYLDWLNILVATGRFDQTHTRSVAMKIKKLAESRGHVVHQVDVPVPGEHPHAHIMDLLLLFISSFGFCILALSGILVANLITAMMALQGRQIGVMKALGATSGQIARIYLLQAALLGTAAILVALPVGILGGRRLTTVLAAFLNFDMSSFGTPAWVYLLAAAAGWAVPLLAAAYPVWRGSRIPIRVALADSGASSETFGTSVLDSLLARFSGRLRPVLMALRNSFRRRVRLALTLATLVAGGVFFLTGLNIRASMMNTLDRYFSAQRFDLSVYLGEMYPRQAIQGAIAKIPGILRSEEWVGTEAAIGKDEVNLVGLPPEAKLLKLDIIRGRNLLPNDTNAAVLNSESAVPGQQITLRMGRAQVSVSVVGISREQFMRQTAYVPLALLDQSGPAGYANNIRLELATKTDSALVERVRTDLDRNLGEAHIRAESFSHTADTRIGFDQHLLMIYVFLIFVSALIAAIGGLGLMTTMSLNILERRREMGVLRAIGATPAMVSLIVVTEGVAIGFLSWVLSGLAAWPLSKILGDMLWRSAFKTSLDFRLDPSALPIWFTVSIFLGVVASLVPAWNAARTTIREALSHE